MLVVRMGPSVIRLPELSPEDLAKLQLEESVSDDPLGEIRQDSTLVYVQNSDKWYFLRSLLDNLLLALLKHCNSMLHTCWEEASLGPSLILMRIPRNEFGVVQAVKEKWQAIAMDNLYAALTSPDVTNQQTLISFTSEPLLKPVRSESISNVLLVQSQGWQVFERLRMDEIWYFTMGIPKRSMLEYKINITDIREQYNLQRDRLITVLDALDAGLVLGESWTTDYPRPFLPVLSYQVRLFSHLDYRAVKELLVALEFLPNGTRIVDYDLYYRNSKVNWIDIAPKDVQRKDILGVRLRQELESRLPDSVLSDLRQIEGQILAARSF